jgi:hypothetical protein
MPAVPRPGSGDVEELETDAPEGSGAARLIMIFVGIMVLLGALWFAWTTFGGKG